MIELSKGYDYMLNYTVPRYAMLSYNLLYYTMSCNTIL